MAKLIGFSAAGKTGTAQKIEPNGRYSHSKYIASFVGFAPAEEPIITVVVMVDEPRPVYFGGVVAAPVFKNVAGDVIRYLKTKPVSRQEFVLNESTKITR
jgi:cell division protein FtsI/penicillin-binding protein 2